MSKKTIFITGASRGVGLAIAKRFAADGANIAIIAKTVDVNPKLPGTLWTARDEIKAAGCNEVLAIPCDIRDLDALKAAINQAGEHFGQIDALINNASSIYLQKTAEVSEKHFDLMHGVIVRASLFAAQYALPYLAKSNNAHILNIAPKPDLQPKWFKNHTAYTICKFSSGMMVMGLAAELAEKQIAVNALWPATLLDTAAVQNLLGGATAVARARKPSIMADAAHYILHQAVSHTGNYYIDEEIIIKSGLDLASYSVVPGSDLIPDLYI
jgi:citronellol/citronellal dehydrogenase